jgi:hypothetical protein
MKKPPNFFLFQLTLLQMNSHLNGYSWNTKKSCPSDRYECTLDKVGVDN